MMIYPIAAIALLWFLLARSNVFPGLLFRMIPRLPEKAGAVLAVLAALAVLVRGNVWVALFLFGVALWLLGRAAHPAAQKPARIGPDISRVRSAMIEMDYDHASGNMYGRIIAGPQEGTPLESLSRQQCEGVYVLCRRDDPDGARLLDAYFDRRFPGWRPAGQDDGDARQSRSRASGRMSEDEAYEVLGLRRGAARDEVVRAHRTVMKKWHPDQGGSADLAARANEAKEVLLRRHA